MMAILFMIGKEVEDKSIITKLFDVELIKERPNYEIACGKNLILSDCGFEGLIWKNTSFFADLETYKQLQEQVREAKIDTCLLKVL